MPTPVVHHCHDIASTPVMPEIVKYLCYYDYVYYNQKSQMFAVETKAKKVTENGFVKVTELRKYWKSADSFD